MGMLVKDKEIAKPHRQEHSTSGSMTRSRNNSPAFQETKRGRPPKFVFPKPATSPDTRPSPKKTAPSTHDLTQMEYSSEESEVSEVSPNERFR